MSRLKLLWWGCLLLLGGCAALPPSPGQKATIAPPAHSVDSSDTRSRQGQETNPGGQPVGEQLPASPGLSIYFTPEATDVPDSAQQALAQQAERLRADARMKLILEAYTDSDLGSQEYCLALSEKWASYVKAALVRHGARASQIIVWPIGKGMSGRCISETCRTAWRRVNLREGH